MLPTIISVVSDNILIKTPLCNSIKKSYQNGELSISQRQAVIKLIEKMNKDKKLVKNWEPIFLMNIDTKLISKVFTERLKKFFFL